MFIKKLIVLILILNFTTANYAQLNEILFNEFIQKIETQKNGEFAPSKNDAMLYSRALNMSNFERANNSKKKKIEMQALDSLVSYNNNRERTVHERPYKVAESFTYDKSGNQLSITTNNFYLDSTETSTAILFKYKNNRLINFNYKTEEENIGKSQYKGEYFYTKYKLRESRLLKLNTLENEWEINHRVDYEYSKNDEIERISYFEIDSAGNEKIDRTISYTYEKNKIIIDEVLSGTTIGRDIILKTIYFFNSKNKIIEKQYTSRSDSKEIIFYDDRGKITAIKTYNFNNNEEKWNITYEYFYTYNKINKIAKLSSTRYSHFTKDTFFYQTNFIYNNNGFIKTNLYQIFDKLTNLFVNVSKYTYNYDSHGNLHEKMYLKWNSYYNQWINESKQLNTYNINYSDQEEVLLPKFSSYNLLDNNISIGTVLHTIFSEPNYNDLSDFLLIDRYWHMQTGDYSYKYNNIDKTWDELQSKTFHYSTHKVKQNSTTQAGIIVFPNPVVNYFTIKIPAIPTDAKIKMYNLSGSKVMEQPVFKDVMIYIDHLQSGLYYFQLFVDGDIVERTGKLMVR